MLIRRYFGGGIKCIKWSAGKFNNMRTRKKHGSQSEQLVLFFVDQYTELDIKLKYGPSY